MTKNWRPRTMRQALEAWPAAVKAVEDNPCDDTLGSLCTLLDVIDHEIARRWDEPGHVARLTSLAECRATARHANALVSAAQVQTRKERGAAAFAARQARKMAA